MKTLIRKEIRLLMPAWITGILLALIPGISIILLAGSYYPANSLLLFFAELIAVAGLLLLSIYSIGGELSNNTFSALLSQPINRRHLWLVKIAILAMAFASIWLVAFLLVSWKLSVSAACPWSYMGLPLGKELWESAKSSYTEFLTLSALATFSGGLWTTLLFRQITAAFWFTLLTPLAIVLGISTAFQDSATLDKSINTFIEIALVLYSIAGFLLAWRLFMRAQDIRWTGGEVSFPCRERTSIFAAGSFSIRPSHWSLALAWKELQLHQGTFLIAAIVLVLHLSTVFIHKFLPHIQNPDLEFILENMWLLWLLMPLLIGSAAIAEERRLGTLEPQLCQPISRFAQLFFKFAFALLLSLFFGFLIPAFIEGNICGSSVGNSGLWVIAENETLKAIDAYNQWHWVAVVVAAIFFVSFYASSLGRTALQSIGFAILVSLVISLYEVAISLPMTTQFGIKLLDSYLSAALLALALAGLTFSNFKHVHQNRIFWIRNMVAILAVFICVPIAARAIYFRPWELVLKLEPRGPVRIADPAQVKLVATRNTIYAISPNGRLWVEPVAYGGGPIDAGRGQFVDGSNWVDVAVNEFELLAIQSDGTLWRLGRNTQTVTMTQIGTNDDWSNVASGVSGFLILKKNGSLWSWGTHRLNWDGKSNPNPTLTQKLTRDFASLPVQMNGDTNWTALYSTGLFSPYARNNNGTIWLLAGNHIIRETNVDNQWSSLQFSGSLSYVEVRTNGDLCYSDRGIIMQMMARRQHAVSRKFPGSGDLEQLGEPGKWKAASFGPIFLWQSVVAIRDDGTLWKFPLRSPPMFNQGLPVQLGNRSDWVAVSEGFSLASDGSIWACVQQSKHVWLAPSRMPVYLGNIFEETGAAN
jgi:ABC-type transport system involved in multi-copper enzyme maturation permease subunit